AGIGCASLRVGALQSLFGKSPRRRGTSQTSALPRRFTTTELLMFRSFWNRLVNPRPRISRRRGPCSQRCRGLRSYRLSLEAPDDRVTPSTFLVTDLNDSGPGALRAAVLAANAPAGADTIRFGPAARDGTIPLTSGQLTITDDLTIDGPGQNRLTVSGTNA